MKKILTLAISFAMILGLAIGFSTVTYADVDYAFDRSWPEQEVIIGVETFNVTDDTWLAVKAYYDHLAEIFNFKFIYSESIASPEQEFAFLDSCAAAGASGIYAYYNASGPSSIMYATNLGMYWVGIIDYYDKFIDNEYYVGGYTFLDETGMTGDYLGGYALGYALGSRDDVTHIVYGSGEMKVAMFQQRGQGFFDGVAAAQAEGSAVRFDPETDVIGGWPDAPTFAPAQTAALTSDYDAVGSANDLSYWFQPAANAGKDMKMAAIGAVTSAYKPYVENGTVAALVYDAPEYVHGAPMIMLLNCCTGHPEMSKNADGTPRLQHVYRWTIDSPELFNAIYDMHEANQYYISDQMTAELFAGLNPDANIDLMETYYDVTMEEAMAK